eukprot:COSAG02_NODE_29935_length_560_cov_0.789588_1_plen_90_part_10
MTTAGNAPPGAAEQADHQRGAAVPVRHAEADALIHHRGERSEARLVAGCEQRLSCSWISELVGNRVAVHVCCVPWWTYRSEKRGRHARIE